MNPQDTLEVIPNSALEAITRGEIDTQIRTAKQFPRSMKKFLQTAIDQATAHVEIAESFIYVRPVGKKDGKMQYAEGMSVRAAEIVGAAYGNLRVGSMIIEQTDRYVVTRGFAHDLESNFASTSENKEPTVTKDGKPFSEGMRAVIAKASLAKARRDATFQVVPRALCRPVETAARSLIAGDAKSLEDRRAVAVQFIQRLNIDSGRVWAALGIAGAEELTSQTLLTLSGIRNAIKDGDTTIDEAFPIPGANPDGTAPKFVPKGEASPKVPVDASVPEDAIPMDHPTPQPEGDIPPTEIPEDPAQLIVWLKAECQTRDIEEKAVVVIAKARKWCGTSATNFSELPQSGRVKVAQHIDEITKELGG